MARGFDEAVVLAIAALSREKPRQPGKVAVCNRARVGSSGKSLLNIEVGKQFFINPGAFKKRNVESYQVVVRAPADRLKR